MRGGWAKLAPLLAKRARLARELACIDEEIAELAAASTDEAPSASDDCFRSIGPLPAGLTRRSFVAKCRRLRAAGDARVGREGRVYFMAREVMLEREPARRASRASVASEATPWTFDGAITRAGARRLRVKGGPMPP